MCISGGSVLCWVLVFLVWLVVLVVLWFSEMVLVFWLCGFRFVSV